MTKLFLKYNPYTVETEMLINDNPVKPPNRLYDLRCERLQIWIEELMPILDEVCNDDTYQIDFYGTRLDYDDLNVCVQEYEKNANVNVTFNFTEAASSEDRFRELVALFQDMQEHCPFEDLTTNQIKENFQNAISSQFEVSVIATMSSGKSTLINALLGRELMPSKNEACTATIAKIKDMDYAEGFCAEYRDKENRVLGKFDDLTLQDMKTMNENPDTAFIDLEGNIPNISSEGVQLVLVDTPGPNNSRTEEHKNHTYRVIKERSKPMVLYVLNATQLQTNDDMELLTAVSDAMKVGGKQSKDRFLFAINKIDTYDTADESIQGAIDNVIEYLGKFDIENPNIFPTSAEMAKLIRMEQNQQELTKFQQRTLRDYDLFLEEESLHLSEQASLSAANKKKLAFMIQEAKERKDDKQEALIHTGVPAVELAINEYLEKYAYTAKVKTAVDTFRKKVEEKDMHAKMMLSIQNDEEARKSINAQLNAVKMQLDEGKAAGAFRSRIQKLDMMEEADQRIAKLRTKITNTLMNRDNKDSMTTLEAQQLLMKLDRKIRNLQSDVKTELENIIEDVILENAQEIMKEYKEHMHQLISAGSLNSDFEMTTSIAFLEEDLPDAQQLIDEYKYSETIDTGEKEWVENANKRWWKPWTWFQEKGHYRTVYQEVNLVDYGTVYDDFIQPIEMNLLENLNAAKETAKEEAQSFKNYFIKELDRLEIILKEKVNENEKLTRNQADIEKKIKEDQEKMKWLEDFLQRLDHVLAI